MCRTEECAVYEGILSAAIGARHKSAMILLSMIFVGGLVGVALLMMTLLVADFSATPPSAAPALEGLKAGLGLILSSISVAGAKEVLDRLSAIAPLKVVCSALRTCESHHELQREAYWAVAKEMAKRV
jgi:hypothetical protein